MHKSIRGIFLVQQMIMVAFVLCLARGVMSQTLSSGTGFFITNDGHIVTNNHVVGDAKEIHTKDFFGQIRKAEIVVRDATNDLAIIRVKDTNSSSLPVRSSVEIRRGDSVFSIGFPNPDLQGGEPKVTQGIVSSLSGASGKPNSFQVSVPLQPGNSGGPLLDLSGAVVGVVSAKLNAAVAYKQSGAIPENVNYAVKSNQLIQLIGSSPEIAPKVISARVFKRAELTSLVEVTEKAVVMIIALQNDLSPTVRPEFPRNSSDQPRPDTDGKRFAIQLGVFGDADNAAMAIERMRTLQLPVQIEKLSIKSGIATRVRVGPYDSLDAAEKAQATIRASGTDGKIILVR